MPRAFIISIANPPSPSPSPSIFTRVVQSASRVFSSEIAEWVLRPLCLSWVTYFGGYVSVSTMATKHPSKSGQSFLLTDSGWASQKVKPFWLQSNRGSKPNLKPVPSGECLLSGGLNIRVEDSEAIKEPNTERLKKLTIHDHPYIKKFTESVVSRKSSAINDLVMRAISEVQEERRPRGEISESTKNTQLYKRLITPVEHRRRTGEAFGHTMVKEILNDAASKLSKSGPIKTLRIQKVPKPKLTKPHDKPKRVPPVRLSPVRNVPVRNPVPHFVDIDQNLWTKEQVDEYDEWWQQLPSCQYACYQLQ